MADLPLVSVVFTSYTLDRIDDICELLDSISTQTYPDIETVFVAERSRELLDRVSSYGKNNGIINVKAIFNEGEQGLSAGRNLGVQHARGEIVAFIDDDSLPLPDWVENIVLAYQDSSVAGTTGPILPLWEDRKMDWFPSELDWILGCCGFLGIEDERSVRNAGGPNMSFRRSVFDKVGLFLTSLGAVGGGGGIGSQDFAGEETEFSIRVRRLTGKRILYSPAIGVRSRVYGYRITLGFIARRAYSEGRTKAMLAREYRVSDEDVPLLNVEYDLLQRILTRLLPGILAGFFTHPVVAWRRLTVTFTALLFVALGYASYRLKSGTKAKQTTAIGGSGA